MVDVKGGGRRGQGRAFLPGQDRAEFVLARGMCAAHAGREQEQAMKGIITGKDVASSVLKGNVIAQGHGLGAQQLLSVCRGTASRLLPLPGSGFGLGCQYLYLDFVGLED